MSYRLDILLVYREVDKVGGKSGVQDMIIRGDRDNLEGKAAWILAENIQYLLTLQRHVVLAVPGGRSVGGVLRYLAKENVDWERVHIFMVDERLVPLGHPECNFTRVKEHFCEIVPLVSLYPFLADPRQEEEGIEAYRRKLAELGGRFDIVLVSSGEDGHIASLFPEMHDPAAEVDNFLLVPAASKSSVGWMTASPRLLLRSQIGVILFFGREKRAALQDFFDDLLTARDCPAKIIGLLPQHYILTDQHACP